MAFHVTYKYKVQKPDFEQRRLEGQRTLKNHPSKVPVVIGKVHKSGLPDLDNFKLLLPSSSKVSDVIQYMNNKLRRPPHAPLYLYVDNDVLAGTDSTLARLYQEYRDTDYFLYISYYEGTASSSDKES